MKQQYKIFTTMCLLLITLSCCRSLYQFPAIKQLSTSVLVGLHEIPNDIKVTKRQNYESLNVWEAAQLNKLQKLNIWTYAVYENIYHSKNKFKPINNLIINLEVVDEFGDYAGSQFLSKVRVQTDSLGYNTEPIRFMSKEPGVYRIKATYSDNNILTICYSPPIIVMN